MPTQQPDPDPILSPTETVPDLPDVEVLDRRLADPFGAPSQPIALTVPGMVPRWFNTDGRLDRIWNAKQQGWTPVTPQMLADRDQVGGFTVSPDNYVTRGERHREVLMMIREDWWKKIQRAKEEYNLRIMRDPGIAKREIVNAAAAKLGGEAAEFMDSHVVGEVRDMKERIHRSEELE